MMEWEEMRGLEVGRYWRKFRVFGRGWRMECEGKNI